MPLPHPYRIHGWIVPTIAALAAVCALVLPGIAQADTGSVAPAPTVIFTAAAGGASALSTGAAPAAGTGQAPANFDNSATTALTPDATTSPDTTVPAPTSTDTASGSANAASSGSVGLYAQPDAASWR